MEPGWGKEGSDIGLEVEFLDGPGSGSWVAAALATRSEAVRTSRERRMVGTGSQRY